MWSDEVVLLEDTMRNTLDATKKFAFGRSLYETSKRFDTLSAGKRADYTRSFTADKKVNVSEATQNGPGSLAKQVPAK